MARFHQPVAQGAQRVGLAGAGQSKGQHVDAALDEAALGQLVQLLPHGQGYAVVLEEPALVKTGVSQVLPEGSLDSRRSRLMRRWRRSSASCSSTSRKVARASPWPAAVKRATDWAPMGNCSRLRGRVGLQSKFRAWLPLCERPDGP